MLGAKLILEILKSEGVDLVFGYPGGQIIPLFDAFHDEEDIRLVLPRHEQAGAHAADGYARVTGRPGVVIATSGPGATNLVTGIATAHMDSIPLVAITGQVPSQLIGNDAFQEVDVSGITRSISKHNFLVIKPDDLPFMLKAAFHIAKSGRPGPVVVDIPSNVQRADITAPIPDAVDLRSYQPNYDGNPRQIERIAKIINRAERPLLYIGGGVVSDSAAEELRRVVDISGIPVTSTLMGLGAFPSSHPLCLGMLGMHGTTWANRAVMECDVLIAVGARFDDRVTGDLDAFAPGATVIHIDIDPTSVSKNVRVQFPVIGSVRNILRQLTPFLEARDPAAQPLAGWMDAIGAWKRERARDIPPGLTPQRILRELSRVFAGRDPVLVTDVGQNQMWAAMYWDHAAPRRLVTSGGLGTMGFGLPAAIGAQLALPENPVVCVTGDGGLQMNIQELATVSRLGLPLKIIVLNNGFLGMVRQWQEMFWERRYSHVDLSDNPDFTRLAEAYGIRAFRIAAEADIAPVLAEAAAHPGPVLVDAAIPREANVYPIVPAGQSLNSVISMD